MRVSSTAVCKLLLLLLLLLLHLQSAHEAVGGELRRVRLQGLGGNEKLLQGNAAGLGFQTRDTRGTERKRERVCVCVRREGWREGSL